MSDEQARDGQGEGAPVAEVVGPAGDGQPSAEGAGTSGPAAPAGGAEKPDVEHVKELWRREQSRADKATALVEKLTEQVETLATRLQERRDDGASEASIQRERDATKQRLAEKWGVGVDVVEDLMRINENVAERVKETVTKSMTEKYDRELAELRSRVSDADPRFVANRADVERLQGYGLTREQAVTVLEKELKKPATVQRPDPGTMAGARVPDRTMPDKDFEADLEAVQAIPGVPKISAANKAALRKKWGGK